MATELTIANDFKNLPAKTQDMLKEWRLSPKKSYDSLPTLRVDKILSNDSPVLAQIKNYVGEPNAIMAISIAIEEVANLVNVGKEMSPRQVATTAKMILKRFWYFKMEDIKSCFYSRITEEKIYTLDPSTLLRWLGEYDLRRDNTCEDLAEREKREDSAKQATTYNAWVDALKQRAQSGDKEAQETLDSHLDFKARLSRCKSLSEEREKEIQFRIFKCKYEQNKKK